MPSGGRNSAGIGYGNNCKEVGTITISGGAVTATGNNTDGIRGYNDETDFSTGRRRCLNPGVSISDKFSREDWSGTIFEGNLGWLYGNPTLNMDGGDPQRQDPDHPGEQCPHHRQRQDPDQQWHDWRLR